MKKLKITVLDAMKWDRVTSATIINCFHHYGFITSSAQSESNVQNTDIDAIKSKQRLEFHFFTIDNLDNTGTLTDEEIALVLKYIHIECPFVFSHNSGIPQQNSTCNPSFCS